MPPQPATTSAVSLNDELFRTIHDATNVATGRRICTRILSQWKKEILPNLSRGECLELLIKPLTVDGVVVATDDDHLDAHKGTKMPSIIGPFFDIIDNDKDGFSTEGHREASVDILKEFFHRAFGDDANGTGSSPDAVEAEDGPLATLLELFLKCSLTFQQRMSRCDVSGEVNVRHGTKMEPREPSEHIRHLLVELLVDLGGYFLDMTSKHFYIRDGDANSKVLIQATSNVCETLAKSTFLDPYSEVQNAACTLAGLLAQMCPLAVRMNAASLLAPLTGITDDSVGGVAQSFDALISKKCLFRHRHSKTRCQAVIASAAIVICCPRQGGINDGKSSSSMQSGAADHLSSYGSKSTTMEQILHDSLLPCWGDLLKLDSSASVQSTVMESLSNIANFLDWRYSPKTADTTSQPQVTPTASLVTNCHHIDRRSHPLSNSSIIDLPSMVGAHILTLFLTGISASSATQVRSLAVQKLIKLQDENDHFLPLEKLGLYFQPMLGLILRSCSQDWASRLSKIRSLEALQILLIIAIPLSNSITSASKLEMSDITIRSIMDVVSTNLLSEEKDVLKSALVLCRIIGANNYLSKSVVELICGDENSALANGREGCEEVHVHSNTSIMAGEKSPRHMTSILLTLDGMMKGSLNPKETTSVLIEMDPSLAIATPDWFCPSIASAVSSFLCDPTITRNTATNSLLAWSLSDACDSFVKSVQTFDNKTELVKRGIIRMSVVIVYLLGCPEQFGLSSCVMNTVHSFSPIGCCAISTPPKRTCDNSCVFDAYFREIFAKIMSIASPFPWKQSEPDFLAIDALLRTCSGSTIGRNFDLVAPFFISHLTTSADIGKEETLGLTQDELAEEYSLRITILALLQTILSDDSFYQNLGYPGAFSSFSAEFTVDVLLSLILPNLVWRSGSMASSLRKLAVATLFSLLSGKSNLVRPDTVAYLIPVLNSNLGDTDPTTRELSCVCLSLVLQQVSSDIYATIGKSSTQIIDSLGSRLLELLDDDADPVRLAGCHTLKDYIFLTHTSAANSSFSHEAASVENIISTLLIQLDDPDQEIQDNVFQVLAYLIELQSRDHTTRSSSEKREIVQMMERHINESLRSHQDGSYCQVLLERIKSYHEREKKTSLKE